MFNGLYYIGICVLIFSSLCAKKLGPCESAPFSRPIAVKFAKLSEHNHFTIMHVGKRPVKRVDCYRGQSELRDKPYTTIIEPYPVPSYQHNDLNTARPNPAIPFE